VEQTRDPRGGTTRLIGMRTLWHTIDDGEFFCPGCGGDRSYRRRTGRRCFVLLGLPLLRRGTAGPVVECAECHHHFGPDVLEGPTTHRLSALLREAVHAVVLAVLAAGGAEHRAVREAAVAAVRDAGYDGCSEEQLLTLLDVAGDGTAAHEDGPAMEAELGVALGALAPHLEAAGRESLLLQGAAVALADGPYRPAERDTLEVVGHTLRLGSADTRRLLAAACTQS
jgi:tellurite resistance protein TerB